MAGISNNILGNISISLGDLDTAIDFLANQDLYSSEDAKTPNKPKTTKESLLNKFDIVHSNSSVKTDDEVIEYASEKYSETQLSFDDDDELENDTNTVENTHNDSGAGEQEYNEEALDIEDENTEEDIDIEDENTEEDIDIEIDEEELGLDNIEFDDESDVEIEDEPEFEDDDSEFDDENSESDNNEPMFDIDEMEIEDEESEIEDDESEIEDDEEEPEFEEDINEDTDESLDEATEALVDEIEIEDIDTEEDNTEDTNLHTSDNNKKPSISNNAKNNTSKNDTDLSNNETVAEMQREMAKMKAELLRLKNDTQKNTSNLGSKSINKNSGDNIDAIVSKLKESKKTEIVSGAYDKYTVLSPDALYQQVKSFMVQQNVRQRPIEISKLNEKFGEQNIKRLIQKSYLIKVGKGVTAGR